MDFFKVTFYDDEWTIYLIESDDEIITNLEAAAQTQWADKEMYFRKNAVTLQMVLHELWHVYFGYCYLSDTNDITLSDMEEISAALFSDKGEKIIQRGKEILDKLLELKKENEEASEKEQGS